MPGHTICDLGEIPNLISFLKFYRFLTFSSSSHLRHSQYISYYSFAFVTVSTTVGRQREPLTVRVCSWIHLKVCQTSSIYTSLNPMSFFQSGQNLLKQSKRAQQLCKSLLQQQKEGDILMDGSHFPSKWNSSVVSRARDIEIYLDAVNV